MNFEVQLTSRKVELLPTATEVALFAVTFLPLQNHTNKMQEAFLISTFLFFIGVIIKYFERESTLFLTDIRVLCSCPFTKQDLKWWLSKQEYPLHLEISLNAVFLLSFCFCHAICGFDLCYYKTNHSLWIGLRTSTRYNS